MKTAFCAETSDLGINHAESNDPVADFPDDSTDSVARWTPEFVTGPAARVPVDSRGLSIRDELDGVDPESASDDETNEIFPLSSSSAFLIRRRRRRSREEEFRGAAALCSDFDHLGSATCPMHKFESVETGTTVDCDGVAVAG